MTRFKIPHEFPPFPSRGRPPTHLADFSRLKPLPCLQELLVPLVTDTDVKIDVAGFAALSLGLVFTSTCNGDAIEAIIQALMMRGELELSSPFAKFLALGLGLLFLGRQEAVEPTVEVRLLFGHLSGQLLCQS